VFAPLSRILREGWYDYELSAMLSWYYSKSAFYFDSHLEPDLVSIVQSFSAPGKSFFEGPFDARGQMGLYWIGVA
jgi:hypothetical protein